jgi:serine phosphatase RsbU (regulator of sigma subunit)
MRGNTTIRGRLLREVVVQIVFLSASIYLVAWWGFGESLETLSGSIISGSSDETELRVRGFVEPVSRHQQMARMWQKGGLLDLDEPDQNDYLLAPVMRAYPQISAVMVADARGWEYMLRRSGSGWHRRRMRRDEWGSSARWLRWTDAGDAATESREELDYDPRNRPWFRGAIAEASRSGAVFWTPPYRFFSDGEPGITAAIALQGPEAPDLVIGFDVHLHQLTEFTASRELRVSKNSRVFIIDEQSREALGLPYDIRLPTRASRKAAVGRKLDDLEFPLIRDTLVADHRRGADGGDVFQFESGRESFWGGVRRFELGAERSLLIGVAVPDDDLRAGLRRVQIWIPLATTLVILLAIWRAFVFSRLISRPIEGLVEESERIRQGDLEEAAEVESGLAEVRQLADAQKRMREGLRSLLKLEGDLQVARQIQQNTFPQNLPSLRGFELDGYSDPADETGGDTYDVIGLQTDARSASIVLTEENAKRAVLLLADATGHGIGPALSVTQLRAMLRMLVRTGNDLPSIARHINEQLCADLPGARFITVWLGLIDADSGALTSWSAGQGPLLRYHASRDAFEVTLPDAPPAGILPDMPIEIAAQLELSPGDLYVVLSDGIFEAANPDDERFGEEAVQNVIREHRAGSASEILLAIRSAVDAFARGRPADDDRTGIVIKRV